MAEYLEFTPAEFDAPAPEVTAPQEPAPGAEAVSTNGQPETQQPAAPSNRHALAGRKGAERIHQLIERGKLYEQEHGLKRGRQRLRQLIEEGKQYEQDHGLAPRRRGKREAPVTHELLLRRLLDLLVRIAKPSYRPALLKMAQGLEGIADQGR
jgi:hypothetical protein